MLPALVKPHGFSRSSIFTYQHHWPSICQLQAFETKKKERLRGLGPKKESPATHEHEYLHHESRTGGGLTVYEIESTGRFNGLHTTGLPCKIHRDERKSLK